MAFGFDSVQLSAATYRLDLDQFTRSPSVVVELLCDEEDDDPE